MVVAIVVGRHIGGVLRARYGVAKTGRATMCACNTTPARAPPRMPGCGGTEEASGKLAVLERLATDSNTSSAKLSIASRETARS